MNSGIPAAFPVARQYDPSLWSLSVIQARKAAAVHTLSARAMLITDLECEFPRNLQICVRKRQSLAAAALVRQKMIPVAWNTLHRGQGVHPCSAARVNVHIVSMSDGTHRHSSVPGRQSHPEDLRRDRGPHIGVHDPVGGFHVVSSVRDLCTVHPLTEVYVPLKASCPKGVALRQSSPGCRAQNELEKRGHKSVRYATDMAIFCKNESSVEQTLSHIIPFTRKSCSRTGIGEDLLRLAEQRDSQNIHHEAVARERNLGVCCMPGHKECSTQDECCGPATWAA